ncbi:MAG: flagellar hook-basal body protein [Bacilli bacterium]|jgi:flagellar basal-body rod protein FlgG
MNGAFYVGATGLSSQQRALEVVAANIANINTPAFKRSQVRFSQLLSATAPADAPAGSPATLPVLAGVAADGERRVFTQGEVKATGEPMDLAIEGDGFVELAGPAGETLLWRGGKLKIGRDGFLAADNGLPLKAMISVPLEATRLTIDRGGVVRATGPEIDEEIGEIELVRVGDPVALRSAGEALYQIDDETLLTPAAPGEEGAGVLVQGAVEGSNVELSEEMIMLLLMQRAYAANAQVVQAGDQLMAIANGLRR